MAEGYYICNCCKSKFERFRVLFDSSPRGDDMYVCPFCGVEDDFDYIEVRNGEEADDEQ